MKPEPGSLPSMLLLFLAIASVAVTGLYFFVLLKTPSVAIFLAASALALLGQILFLALSFIRKGEAVDVGNVLEVSYDGQAISGWTMAGMIGPAALAMAAVKFFGLDVSSLALIPSMIWVALTFFQVARATSYYVQHAPQPIFRRRTVR